MTGSIMSHQEWFRAVGGVHAVEKDKQLLAIDEVLYAYSKAAKAPVVFRSRWKTDAGDQRQLLGALQNALAKWYAGVPAKADNAYTATLKIYRQFHPEIPSLSPLEIELQHARLGVLYLFSNLNPRLFYAQDVASIVFGSIDIALDQTDKMSAVDAPFVDAGMSKPVAHFIKGKGTAVMTEGASIAEKVARSGKVENDHEIRSAVRRVIHRIWRFIVDFAEAVTDKLNGVLRSYLEDPSQIFELMVDIVMKQVVPKMVPFYSAAKDLVKDMSGLLENGVFALIEYIKRGAVSFSQFGAAIIGGINRGRAWMLGNDVLRAIADSVSLPLSLIGWPGNKVKDMVVSAAMTIAKICYRTWECSRFKSFCREAKRRYDEGGFATNGVVNSDAALSIDARSFDEWFFASARAVPIIAALTLSSRVCGGKYTHLRMSDSGKNIDQNEYNRGAAYLDSLASDARRYIEKSRFDLMIGCGQIKALVESWKRVIDGPSIPPGGMRINPRFVEQKHTFNSRALADYKSAF